MYKLACTVQVVPKYASKVKIQKVVPQYTYYNRPSLLQELLSELTKNSMKTDLLWYMVMIHHDDKCEFSSSEAGHLKIHSGEKVKKMQPV